MKTLDIPAPTGARRNAPSVNSRLSVLVDVATDAADTARAAGLHAIADEIDAIRRQAAAIACRLWRAEGGER